MKKQLIIFLLSALSVGAIIGFIQYEKQYEFESSLRESNPYAMSSVGVPDKAYFVYNFVSDHYFNPNLKPGVPKWVLSSTNAMIIGNLNPQDIAVETELPQNILDTLALVKDRTDYYVFLQIGSTDDTNNFQNLDKFSTAKNLAQIAKKYNVGIYIQSGQSDSVSIFVSYYRLFNPYGESKMSQLLVVPYHFYQDLQIFDGFQGDKINSIINWAIVFNIDALSQNDNLEGNSNLGSQQVSLPSQKKIIARYASKSCSNIDYIEQAINYQNKDLKPIKGVYFHMTISPKNCEHYPQPNCGVVNNHDIYIGDGPLNNLSCPAITEVFKRFIH